MGRVCKSKEIKPTIILVGIWRLATSRISLKGLEWEQHMIYLDAIIVPSSLLPSIRLDTSLFYYEVNLQQVITPIHTYVYSHRITLPRKVHKSIFLENSESRHLCIIKRTDAHYSSNDVIIIMLGGSYNP